MLIDDSVQQKSGRIQGCSWLAHAAEILSSHSACFKLGRRYHDARLIASHTDSLKAKLHAPEI